MSVIVTEAGFAADDWTHEFLAFDAVLTGENLPETGLSIEFPNDRDPADLAPWLDRIELIRVAFPAHTDGRGFSVGRRLRELGYTGRLRAAGPIISDQFRMARRVGFDEVEIPDALAERQPEPHWRLRPQGSYLNRLIA